METPTRSQKPTQRNPAVESVFDVVERYWTAAPVDIIAIIQDVGIVYDEEFLWPSESGLIERFGASYRIAVNQSHALVRRRFTAAHELGHYVYHRDLIGDGISDNALYRSEEQVRYHNSNITRRHESEANNFAAIVLMPTKLIYGLQKQYHLSTQSEADVIQLAKLLQVSEQALKIRLKSA